MPQVELEITATIDGYRLPPARVYAPQVWNVTLEALNDVHKVEQACKDLRICELERTNSDLQQQLKEVRSLLNKKSRFRNKK